MQLAGFHVRHLSFVHRQMGGTNGKNKSAARLGSQKPWELSLGRTRANVRAVGVYLGVENKDTLNRGQVPFFK